MNYDKHRNDLTWNIVLFFFPDRLFYIFETNHFKSDQLK